MRTSMRHGPGIRIRGPVSVPEPVPPSATTARTPRHRHRAGALGCAGVTTLAAAYGGHDCGR
ncbi:hypothetical protein NGM37_16285, partial [Streptomyces sp. TRM76130]|nr:hypothetical protein [Streptomyces sp. TRM76130]